MSESKSEVESALGAIGAGIMLMLTIGFAFFNAPGMIIMYFISQFLPSLVVPQMWTFSIVISAVVFGVAALALRDVAAAAGFVCFAGALIIATFLIMKFGFLSGFPEHVMVAYGFH